MCTRLKCAARMKRTYPHGILLENKDVCGEVLIDGLNDLDPVLVSLMCLRRCCTKSSSAAAAFVFWAKDIIKILVPSY